ncbi:hypothetical protein E0Z10_g6831 [Xylaria hypoxylon]|uniref:C2H2-type domain-containing protein n=1 Tax=Xylaria hypoxylon TaxID=37992 RepID=A0A4Z0YZT4_9PEZI|nr:hypothetical protein E0Z10_g6831 [Xylaria hypoxylon]
MARTTRNSTGNLAVGGLPSANEKRFACSHPGCNKRFTRAEHVQRHALNHTAGQYTCLDCRAHFKRPDLLKRHMTRHRQREQEADGPSKAILNTRKRSWKTLTGEVVEKRPYPFGGSNRNCQQEDVSTAEERLSFDSGSSISDITTPTLIPRQSDTNDDPVHNVSSDFDFRYQQESNVLSHNATLCNFMDPSFYDFEHFEYDQNFQPDTASSFNMPYTTSLDYNWLFSDPSQAHIQQSSEIAIGATTQRPYVSAPENHLIQNVSVQRFQHAATPESLESIENWVDPDIESPDGVARANAARPGEAAQSDLTLVPPRGTLEISSGKSGQEGTRKRTEPSLPSVGAPVRIIPSDTERPLSMLRKQPQIPSINCETRGRLLSVIEVANPSIADRQCSVREHPLLSVHHLNSYLELYFTNFNTAYPLLHLASFDTCTVEPLLLLSVLLLGATYSTKDSHQLAVVDFASSPAGGMLRLSLLCFMWDTQHAVLFCQSLCMSSFELRITLPCSQEIWEAPDAQSWAAAWRSSGSRDDKVSFLAALKSYLNHGLPRPAILSALSRVLLLHGLMSVAWDMQRREQTSLGVVLDSSSGDNWRKSLGAAYDTWKLDFDAHCEATAARNRKGGESGSGDNGETDFSSFATAYNPVYHAAKTLLNMDFLDIQIYAGSRHILGRPVLQKDYIRSSQVVKRWAAASNQGPPQQQSRSYICSSTASWHAARLLYEASEGLLNSKAMGLFHVPWCLYLATLTCWAVQ